MHAVRRFFAALWVAHKLLMYIMHILVNWSVCVDQIHFLLLSTVLLPPQLHYTIIHVHVTVHVHMYFKERCMDLSSK